MTSLIMFALFMAGFFSFRHLPVSDLPNIDYPIIRVSGYYSGANPETMANQVTIPLENELMNISGLKRVSSYSGRGYSTITLLFDLNKNIDEAAQEVQAALSRAEGNLPHEMTSRPTYRKVDGQQDNIMYLVLTSPTLTIAELYDYAHQEVEQQLARIEGISKAEVYGSPFAIHLQLNPELLAARSIGFDEVLSAIRSYNTNLPLGILNTDERKFTIELDGSLLNGGDFGNIILSRQNPLQAPVRLKDVSAIVEGLESDEAYHFVTAKTSESAIILGIQKQNGANTVSISKLIREKIPSIKKELPPSIDLKLWFDKAEWIQEAVSDVEWSLLTAFVLVIVVIFFSIGRIAEALIPSLSLPFSLIGTFIVMALLNFSFDILSLLALTLSVGFVVDDAIVVLENIVRYNEKGIPRLRAALIGSKQIGFTILSMTFSLVAVFIPLLFMRDIYGRLFREFSLTLASAILVSGFISLSLTPMLCSRFLSSHENPTVLQSFVTGMNKKLLVWYGRTLEKCLQWRKIVLSSAIVSFLLMIPLIKLLPVDLFPQEDRGYIRSYAKMPRGISSQQATLYQDKIKSVLQACSSIDSFITLSSPDYRMFLIKLIPIDQRPTQSKIIEDLQKEINAVPGIQASMRGLQLIDLNLLGSSGNAYQYVLTGPDLPQLHQTAETFKKALMEHPEFSQISLNLEINDPKLKVSVFEEHAEKYGFSKQKIQTMIQHAYVGTSVGTIKKNNTQYKVFLELSPEYQRNVNALGKLYLKSNSGAIVPLKAVATWKETVGLPAIRHLDHMPAITLSFDIAGNVPLNKALDTLQDIAKKTFPPTVSGKLEGGAEKIASTVYDTAILAGYAVVVMYIVLGILYESFIHPLTILSSLPFAGLGGILTLLLFREPISLYSMVGFILLIGLVKKNGIMMIDYAIEARKDRSISAEKAIFDGCMVRFRPIMMTTVAAIMGALPIAFGLGAGAETRRGLGLVIAGGLLFAQILTLYVTPVIYLTTESLWMKIIQFFAHRRKVKVAENSLEV
jgi:HAE1 family hydrophobic/amphiphilic exporter-1